MKRIPLFVLCFGALCSARAETAGRRQVLFRVEVREAPAPRERVYLSGNVPELGGWKADGFALEPAGDGRWTGVVDLPAGETVEFKLTKGSWDTERLLVDGSTPANEVLEPGGDSAVDLIVHRWKRPGPPPEPEITGMYRVHEAVPSTHLAHARRVIVWLPPSYEEQPDRRYPVLYMHDGQQVFDPGTSTHGQDWEVDEWCARLIAGDRMEEIIVVAAYCTPARYREYHPGVEGDRYARFLVEELKPMIDRTYRTLPGRDTTAVAGASMGGKISFYLAWARPEVFFGAACLSSAFAYDPATELDAVRATAVAPDIKLYLYCGGGDPLEKKLLPGTREMASLLEERGFRTGGNLRVAIDEAAVHNEAAWKTVTGDWLAFLFPKR